MKSKRKSILAIVFLGLSLGLSLMMAGRTSAINSSSIVSKAVFEGVYGCFNGGAFRKTFHASNVSAFILNDGSNEAVKLPYGMTNVGDNNLNCREVMLGYNNDAGIKGGLVPTNVRTAGADITAVKTYFAGQTVGGNGLPVAGAAAIGNNTTTSGGIGYTAEAETEGTGGISKTLTYSIGEHNCISGESNPTFNGKTSITFPTVVSTDSGLKITSNNDISSNGASFNVGNCGNLKFTVGIPVEDSDSVTFDVTLNDVGYQTITYTKNGNDISITERGLTIGDDAGNYVNLNPKTTQASAGSSTISDYKLTWGGGNWTTLLKGLNSNNRAGISVNQVYAGYNYLALTRQELFDLYVHYIESSNIMNAKLVAEGQNDFSGVDVNLCTDKKYKVNKSTASGRTVYGVDSNLHFNAGPLSLDDLIKTLDANGPYDDIDNGGRCKVSNSTPLNPDGGSSTTVDQGFCDKMVDEGTNGEGVGAMQWILCPTLDNSTYTANWVDNMTQDMLEVKSSLYEPGSPTQEAWGKIRDAANVLMVLFLLVIIFSQLTGYGIDNYGIKKMLPRLITMAIIVNLSFYICAIAVDISNIAGTGLRDLFGGIGTGLSGGAVDANTGFVSTSVTGLFTAAGIGGGAAVGAAGTAVTLGAPLVVAILIAALVLVLVVIVAVVILYLMLGVREIIIIFCVLISPLAFAAFILPNTQHLFKKWWNLFKAAIIIFPICGAVAGISYILKNITTGSDVGIGTKAVMMVMPFVGFFFLPELLKQAIAALGKLGGALTSMGQTMRGGARTLGHGAASLGKSTEWYKNLEREGHRANVMRRQTRLNRRFDRAKEAANAPGASEAAKRRFERMQTGRRGRTYARADETAEALTQEDIKASEVLLNRQYGNESLDELVNLSDAAAEAGDWDRMDALNNLIYSRHGAGGAKAIADRFGTKDYFENGEFKNEHMEQMFKRMRNNMSKNANLSNAMSRKSSDVFQMFTSGGYYSDGSGSEPVKGNLAMHSKYNDMMTKDSDRATQSSSTLRRAFNANAMTAEDADRMLNSTDDSIVSGILSEKEKADMLMASAAGYNKWGSDFDPNSAEFKNAVATWKAAHPDWDKRAANIQKANQAMIDAAGSLERAADRMGGTAGGGETFEGGSGI